MSELESFAFSPLGAYWISPLGARYFRANLNAFVENSINVLEHRVTLRLGGGGTPFSQIDAQTLNGSVIWFTDGLTLLLSKFMDRVTIASGTTLMVPKRISTVNYTTGPDPTDTYSSHPGWSFSSDEGTDTCYPTTDGVGTKTSISVSAVGNVVTASLTFRLGNTWINAARAPCKGLAFIVENTLAANRKLLCTALLDGSMITTPNDGNGRRCEVDYAIDMEVV